MHKGTVAGIPRLLYDELSVEYGDAANEHRLESLGKKYLVRGLPKLGYFGGLACVVLTEYTDSYDHVGIVALLPTYAKSPKDVAHLTNCEAASFVEARHGHKPKHPFDRFLYTGCDVGFGKGHVALDHPLWPLTRVLFDRAAELAAPFPTRIPLEKVA